jgi:hypothetical protein
MASLSAIRDAIATNLATVAGLRTQGLIPGQVNPPYAIITPESIDYHRAFANGYNTYNFTITVVVGQADSRTAQSKLDAYCSPTGSESIKVAIESNRTLSGLVFDLMVSDMRNYGSTTIGETTYLAAEFTLAVQAN